MGGEEPFLSPPGSLICILTHTHTHTHERSSSYRALFDDAVTLPLPPSSNLSGAWIQPMSLPSCFNEFSTDSIPQFSEREREIERERESTEIQN